VIGTSSGHADGGQRNCAAREDGHNQLRGPEAGRLPHDHSASIAITRATNAPRRSAGTTLQTMISTFEIRKQADQMDDKGDEIEPPTPSLTYRSGRWWAGRFQPPAHVFDVTVGDLDRDDCAQQDPEWRSRRR